MFHGYARIRIEQQLQGGYTPSSLFVVTPIQTDNRIDSTVVVKVGPTDVILDEAHRYERYVKSTLPPLTARLEEAKRKLEVAITNFEDQQTQFSLYQNLKDKRAVSENEFNQRFYSAELALKQIKEAEANIELIKTNIYRSTIRAPITGEVLQVNVHVGESAEKNPFDSKALMLFGQTDPLHIRVEVDEADAWRVGKGAEAMAYVRGNSSISVPLKFLYIEPYIIPKNALTGDNTERVDTRVLQIIYKFHRDSLPIYPGQIMDVYIKGLPADERF